ncbi:hypothetical protein C8R46DRAFT_1311257 [Mycena filopes]|nr:hypothetical protein C8R46DRAFT_1311257 [Mycena filopes]
MEAVVLDHLHSVAFQHQLLGRTILGPKAKILSITRRPRLWCFHRGLEERTRGGIDLYHEMIETKLDGESKVALVFGQMNEPSCARARVALTGLTIAEYFLNEEDGTCCSSPTTFSASLHVHCYLPMTAFDAQRERRASQRARAARNT